MLSNRFQQAKSQRSCIYAPLQSLMRVEVGTLLVGERFDDLGLTTGLIPACYPIAGVISFIFEALKVSLLIGSL